MNIFRILADLLHVASFLVLLVKIWKSKSSAGISGRSQVLFALVFATRYLDLFTNFISLYNSVMKLFFLMSTFGIIYLMFYKFKHTYDRNHDTFRIDFLVLPSAILAFYINHEFEIFEILWTFSIYLESVAVLPQLFMISKIGVVESKTSHYLLMLGAYRAIYILNWVYRFLDEGF